MTTENEIPPNREEDDLSNMRFIKLHYEKNPYYLNVDHIASFGKSMCLQDNGKTYIEKTTDRNDNDTSMADESVDEVIFKIKVRNGGVL